MKLSRTQLKIPHLPVAQRWLIVMTSTLVAGLVIAAYSVFVFIRASHADVISDTPHAGVDTISRESLHDAVQSFQARQRAFGETGGARPAIPAQTSASSSEQ
jgi:hypothetical protein